MNIFFDHKASKNDENKNEIDFILTNKLNTVKNVATLNKLVK